MYFLINKIKTILNRNKNVIFFIFPKLKIERNLLKIILFIILNYKNWY